MSTGVLETRSASARPVALALGTGGVLQIAGGLWETVDRALPSDPQYPVRASLMLLTYAAFAVGLVLLARRRPIAGADRARTTGIVIAVGGWSVMAMALLILMWDQAFAEQVIFPVGLLLVAAGMLVAGVAMLRILEPTRGTRWLPLLCGAFPVVVVFPAFAVLGGPNFLILAANGACWAGLAVAYARLDHD